MPPCAALQLPHPVPRPHLARPTPSLTLTPPRPDPLSRSTAPARPPSPGPGLTISSPNSPSTGYVGANIDSRSQHKGPPWTEWRFKHICKGIHNICWSSIFIIIKPRTLLYDGMC